MYFDHDHDSMGKITYSHERGYNKNNRIIKYQYLICMQILIYSTHLAKIDHDQKNVLSSESFSARQMH